MPKLPKKKDFVPKIKHVHITNFRKQSNSPSVISQRENDHKHNLWVCTHWVNIANLVSPLFVVPTRQTSLVVSSSVTLFQFYVLPLPACVSLLHSKKCRISSPLKKHWPTRNFWSTYWKKHRSAGILPFMLEDFQMPKIQPRGGSYKRQQTKKGPN